MTISSLLAWIEADDHGTVAGCFVGEGVVSEPSGAQAPRAPAVLLCDSAEEARRWIEQEAVHVGVPVKWLDQPPRPY